MVPSADVPLPEPVLTKISDDIDGILPKGPYPPCLRMADRALVAGYPQQKVSLGHNEPMQHTGIPH